MRTKPKARYFLGLADEQDGNRDAAAAKWRALLEDAPPDAPWVEFRARGAGARHRRAGRRAGPSAGDVAAADSMTESSAPR